MLAPPWYGQLGNQLVAIAKAYAIAGALNRTFVVPFLQPANQIPIRTVSFFDIFSKQRLRQGPVSIMTAFEYKQLHISPKYDVGMTCEVFFSFHLVHFCLQVW